MSHHLPSPVNYREDINGLRAYAVIAVLLFHFSLIGLPGGFAGVDVFFVISGYLMAAIVIGGHLKGNFSLVKFYMARARRILPALMVMIATLLVVGWFWLPTPDYQSLGVQSSYALSFLSNIYFWKTSGYFDSSSHEKWLLHTWSLAVEAQFYIIFPIFIALIWRFWKSIKAVTVAMLLLFSISLVISLFLTYSKPTPAFYLLPSRGWELASGGLVYLATYLHWPSLGLKKVGYWIGWVLIFVTFFVVNESNPWPGYHALLPVLGASLVILGHNENCKLTNNSIAQWLGDRSYSLYLWHWPLVVALYFASIQNEWLYVAIAFMFSLLLAHLSYHLVEKPTRIFFSRQELKVEFLYFIFLFLLLLFISLYLSNKFISGRIQDSIEKLAFSSQDFDPRKEKCTDSINLKMDVVKPVDCVYGELNSTAVIVIGDSHSAAIISAIERVLNNKKIGSARLWSLNGCQTILDKDYVNGTCLNFNNIVIENTKKYKGVPVVIINRFTNEYIKGQEKASINKNLFHEIADKVYDKFSSSLNDVYCEISKTNPVYILRQIPQMPDNVPKKMSRDLILKKENDNYTYKYSYENYISETNLVHMAQDRISKYCNVTILDPIPYLCDDKYCYGSKDGRALYYDDDHLSEYGNKLLEPMFEKIFKDSSIILGNQ